MKLILRPIALGIIVILLPTASVLAQAPAQQLCGQHHPITSNSAAIVFGGGAFLCLESFRCSTRLTAIQEASRQSRKLTRLLLSVEILDEVLRSRV